MASRENIIQSQEYWMEMVQGEVFRLLSDYMGKNNLNQTQVAAQLSVSSSYISQILNGNFNFTIAKLISLALAVGKVPILSFEGFEEHIANEKFPLNQYRYMHFDNNDGGYFADVVVEQTSLFNVPAGEPISFSVDSNAAWN